MGKGVLPMYKFFIPWIAAIPCLLFAEVQETIAIVKPDAVSNKHVGDIIKRYEGEGFTITNIKMVQLSKPQAEEFYIEHNSKPFFKDLITYMSSGPVVVIQLKGEDAIAKNRELIGTTNPQEAQPNTLRALYGITKSRNGIHGSDSKESAEREIRFFFNQINLN